jgi:2-dehydro-3-deoxyphosphooctonate aldolase (KDO 8-P synthase)
MNLITLKNKFFIIVGPNVIESEEHTLKMAKSLKDIFSNYNVNFIFKTSIDKANRSSLNSYRGLGFEEGLRILKKVKEELDIPIITDIHESWQAKPVGEVVDIIQIPAFLCRQTDLLKAAAETGKIIHVKKGQFCSAEQMHKCKEKIIAFGNPNVILCERGNSFGYQDLVVDPRNLIWLKSDTNLVSMDITHCLQQPSQKMADGTVKSGGLRDMIPYMGKMAISLGVDGIFLEVHDRPDESKCDAPTQWPLDKLEWLLGYLDINKLNNEIMEYNFYENKISEKCILCKTNLDNTKLIYDTEIRGDEDKKCKIIKCNICGHIQLIGFRENLKTHYDEDSQSNDIVRTFNLTKKDIIDKEKIEIERRIKYLNLNNNIKYKILDVGAGYCSFGNNLSINNNINITCLEPSKKRTDIGSKINNIKSNNIIIKNDYLDDIFVLKNESKFDIITLWHVLEHLDEHNIDIIIQNMYKCCKIGGKIIIEVPNGNDELFKYDKYKQINYMIHHLSYWTENTLKLLMRNNNIKNYKIDFVQRYGYNNYLNWIYNLGEKQNCNMNNDIEHLDWLEAKRKSKNTDAILIIINK